MVAKSILHHLETMVETITYIGIYRGIESEPTVSEFGGADFWGVGTPPKVV